jgi:hypothetical protein
VGTYPFLYRCPITGHKVQGLAQAPTPDHSYEAVTCTACNRVHLVNPNSRHVAGADGGGDADEGASMWKS